MQISLNQQLYFKVTVLNYLSNIACYDMYYVFLEKNLTYLLTKSYFNCFTFTE